MQMATQIVRNTLDSEYYSLRNMYLSVFVVKTTYMYVGMAFAWTFLLVPRLKTSLLLSVWEEAAVLASFPLGMTLGPISGSILAPRYGFKSIFVEFGCLSLASGLFLAFRQPSVVCVARFTAGLAIGVVLCYLEAYLHDISDKEVRMILDPLNLVFFTLGFYIVYDIGQIFSYFKMLLLLLTLPLVFLICLSWLPESPYFQVATGQLDNAKRIVNFLYRGISTRGLDQLMLLIQEDVKRREVEAGISFPPFHKDPKTARVSLVFFALLCLTGFPVVLMLMEPLVTEAQRGVAVSSSLSAVARVALCPIAVAWVLNSKYTTRLKMVSSAVMSLSMATLGIFFFLLDNGHEEVTLIPLICMILYTIAFLVGFVHKSDTTVPNFRQQTTGRVLSLSVGFTVMFLVVFLYVPLKYALGTAPILWIFSAVSVLLSVFIAVYSPEASLF